MAKSARVRIEFNESFFDAVLNSQGVRNLVRSKAEQVLAAAQASAPVETGAYRAGLRLTTRQSAHRQVCVVAGTDPKTLLVESKTGNLARSLRKVGN